jgi:hypothetical protein
VPEVTQEVTYNLGAAPITITIPAFTRTPAECSVIPLAVTFPEALHEIAHMHEEEDNMIKVFGVDATPGEYDITVQALTPRNQVIPDAKIVIKVKI